MYINRDIFDELFSIHTYHTGQILVAHSYVYKDYPLDVPADKFIDRLTDKLAESDIVRKSDDSGNAVYRNSSLTFSSTKPLSCISRMTVLASEPAAGESVGIGMNFLKIKLYTIFIMIFFCVVLPIALNYYQHNSTDMSITSLIGIPLGFFLHFHVRGRALNAMNRLVRQLELELERETANG